MPNQRPVGQRPFPGANDASASKIDPGSDRHDQRRNTLRRKEEVDPRVVNEEADCREPEECLGGNAIQVGFALPQEGGQQREIGVMNVADPHIGAEKEAGIPRLLDRRHRRATQPPAPREEARSDHAGQD